MNCICNTYNDQHGHFTRMVNPACREHGELWEKGIVLPKGPPPRFFKNETCIQITPQQCNELMRLNSIWDGLTTVRGLTEYIRILGNEKTTMIVEAAIRKQKVLMEVIND